MMTLSLEGLTGVDEAPFHTGLAAWPLPIDKLDPRHSDFDGLEWLRAGLDAASPVVSPAGMAWANLSVPACAAYQSPSQT